LCTFKYTSLTLLSKVSLLLIGQKDLLDFFRYIGPSFPLAGGLCKFFDNAGGKQQIQRQLLLVQYKQQANPLLSMNNYTPLVVSRNDKNKQLAIIKPKQTSINRNKDTFCIIKSSETLKNKTNQPRPLVTPSSVNFCQHFLNLSRETVPLKRLHAEHAVKSTRRMLSVRLDH
jgi:hypothetical protein